MSTETTPYGCAACGTPKDKHGRRWHPEAEMHNWQKPSEQQVKDRMLARRTARKETGR